MLSSTRPVSFLHRYVLRAILSEYLVLYLTAVYFLLMAVIVPDLMTVRNLLNILQNSLPLLIAAAGQTVVMITAGIDLSVPAIIGAASVGGAAVMTADGGTFAGSPLVVPAGCLLILGIGLLLGFINGGAVARLRMPPFIVTLSTMIFFSGFAVWSTQSQNIYNLPEGFLAIAQSHFLFLPLTFWLTLLLLAAMHGMLQYTILGRWLYAVGSGLQVSEVSGVPVRKVLVAAYVISGVCASVAAVVYTARLETGSPVMGEHILLDVIGATVIGGTSLFGGRGKVLWTVFGVLFITVIDNSLNMLGMSYFIIMVAKGLVILFAALLDAVRNRWLREA